MRAVLNGWHLDALGWPLDLSTAFEKASIDPPDQRVDQPVLDGLPSTTPFTDSLQDTIERVCRFRKDVVPDMLKSLKQSFSAALWRVVARRWTGSAASELMD